MVTYISGMTTIVSITFAGITFLAMNLAKHHIKVAKIFAALTAIFGGITVIAFAVGTIFALLK